MLLSSPVGNNMKTAEVYSPNGLCSFSRSPMPVPKTRHTLIWRNKEIIACGEHDVEPDCYIYFIANDTWALYSTAPLTNGPYTVYNDSL